MAGERDWFDEVPFRAGAEHVAHTRATLAALIEGNYGAEEDDRGQPRAAASDNDTPTAGMAPRG